MFLDCETHKNSYFLEFERIIDIEERWMRI